MKYSHIVWVTFDSWLPHEKRGDWKDLADFYQSLERDFIVNFSKPLQNNYTKIQNPTQLILSSSDQEILKKDIIELAINESIAGGLEIISIGLTPNGVHLLIRGAFSEKKQKLSRLKSRSATLLKYTNGLTEISAKNTWSKGFWVAEFNEHHDVFKIKNSNAHNKVLNADKSTLHKHVVRCRSLYHMPVPLRFAG